MKKKLIATIAILMLSLTTFAGGVFASELYTNWNGTSAYNNILITLDSIKQRGQELKTERDNSNRSNEQLVNQIKDKENVIKDKDNQLNAKEQEIAAKQKEIDNLKNAATNNSDQLKQAEKDMKDVDSKAKDVLNGMKQEDE